jgi:hypothetical protein
VHFFVGKTGRERENAYPAASAPRSSKALAVLDTVDVFEALFERPPEVRAVSLPSPPRARKRARSAFESGHRGAVGGLARRLGFALHGQTTCAHPDANHLLVGHVERPKEEIVFSERPQFLGQRPPVDAHDGHAGDSGSQERERVPEGSAHVMLLPESRRQEASEGKKVHHALREHRVTRRFPLEIAAVWALFAFVATEIFVTYARLPAGDLYHVSRSGLRGGAGRSLVFLNFPLALVAIAVAGLVFPLLRTGREHAAAVVGAALAAAIFWPGIVKQSDLDARWVNAGPALGVAAILVLGLGAAVRLGLATTGTQAWDRWRLVVAAAALLLAPPWLAADLGLSFDGVPVLGTLYQSAELRAQPHVSGLHPAVHHGHHHGMDGVLLVLSALLLSRVLSALPSRRARLIAGAYLALMLCYGTGNLANDFWLEQVVKRGWTDRAIPDVTTPSANGGWLAIVAAAAVVWILGAVLSRRPGTDAPRHEVETA